MTMFEVTLKIAIIDTLVENGWSMYPNTIDYYVENFSISTLTEWVTRFLNRG